uniref:Uncharacterized protein n=1 Tax=Anopheles arabiensis TaxID=7173 RepID=A0A182IFZ1_ANOAR
MKGVFVWNSYRFFFFYFVRN